MRFVKEESHDSNHTAKILYLSKRADLFYHLKEK